MSLVMAVALRIEGVNIPVNKHICIGLTAIYGIGRPLALRICKELEIDPQTKGSEIKNFKKIFLREGNVFFQLFGFINGNQLIFP